MNFPRPDSPPPRQPSPEPVPTPLHPRSRRPSPHAPPGLAPPRVLQQSRSYDHLNIKRRSSLRREGGSQTLKRRVRSNLEPVAHDSEESPASSLSPSVTPSRSPSNASSYRQRRMTSVLASNSFNPPLPSNGSFRPPVPPLPESARSSPSSFKITPPSSAASTQGSNVTPIYLADLHQLSPTSTRTLSEKKSFSKRLFSSATPASTPSTPPTPQQEKSKTSSGMAYFKFFSLRHSSSRTLRSETNTPA